MQSSGVNTVKIGAVVLGGILGLWGAVILISGVDKLSFGNTYYVFAVFDRSTGLKPKMEVRASGHPVGFVEWSEWDDDLRKTKAKIRISKAVTIHPGSSFVIGQSGLIGDSSLSLVDPPARTAGAVVKEGDTLPGTSQGSIDDLIAQADQVLKRVDSLLGEDSMGGALRDMTQSVNASLQKVNGIVDQVDNLMVVNGKLITSSMQNVEAMSSGFLRLSVNLEETSVSIRELATDPKNREQMDTVLANLNAASASLAATSAHAEALSGDAELQQNIKDTLRLTKETLEETKKTVTQFQGTLGAMDDTLHKAGGLLDSTGAAVDKAGGTLDWINRKTGAGKGTESGKEAGTAKGTGGGGKDAGIEASAGLYLRGIDHNASRGLDAQDRVVVDAKARIGLGGKYIATGVDNIGSGGDINLLLGLGSAVSGGSVRGGVYRGELGAGLAYYSGGFGAEVTAYSPQNPKLDAYGYVPVGDSVDIVLGVEDATGSAKLTAGAGVKF